MGDDGPSQAPAAGLQGRDALEEGLLHYVRAPAGAGLLEAALLAPQVGLDVVEPRHERLEVGDGLGRRLLAELERHARDAGVRTLRLDTNRALTEAIGLYRAAGYEEIERFNDEPHAHHWFAKSLG